MNIFDSEQYETVESNTFDLSHEHKTTFRMGRLYPVEVMEILPGDSVKMKTTKLMRMLPLIAPVMHRINITETWFFVPARLCWKNWEAFITGSGAEIVTPTISWYNPSFLPVNATQTQCIGAYMGLPLNQAAPDLWLVDAMPLAAYSLIWNQFYRDENLEGELKVELQDGENFTVSGGIGDITLNYSSVPLAKAWKKDYFTGALPFAQKGTPVQIPLSGANPLKVALDFTLTNAMTVRRSSDRALVTTSNILFNAATTGAVVAGAPTVVIDPNDQLFVTEGNAATMNSFRVAMALQSFLEKDARSGTRYIETLQGHFGAHPPDYRLQRPEFIGSNTQNINISEVLSQTESGTAGDPTFTPIGQMAGKGISASQGSYESYRADEHGYLICLLSIAPDLNYINVGLHKQWQRQTREDYAWPSFAHLGEQAIRNYEIHAGHLDPQNVFGYIPRYSEYKFRPSIVSGDFSTTLAYWHLAIEVPDDVALNGNFIRIDDQQYDLARIFAFSGDGPPDVTLTDYLICQIYFEMTINRRLPRFAVPKLIG